MVFHEPRGGLGLRRRKAQAGTEAARDLRSGDRVVLDPPFGDVVQEQRHVEHGAVLRLDGADQLARELELVAAAVLDLGQHADAAQQVLVDRVVMIHVELHHRDDAAERTHEAPEHARLVHAAQHPLGIVGRGEDLQEQPVGLGVLAQAIVDQGKRARRDPNGVGMEREAVPVGEMEDADQVDRVAAEYVRRGDVDAVVVDDEILGLAQGTPPARAEPRHHPAQHRQRHLAVL